MTVDGPRRAADPSPGFRPLTREDFALLAVWLDEPHVSPWWRDPHGPEDLEAVFGATVDGDDPTEVRIVTIGDGPVGLVQRYRLRDEPAWRGALAPTGVPLDAFGIDYLIGDPDRIGQGLGTRMVDRFLADSWARYPEAPACVVGVHRDNRRSVRMLERLGFVTAWEGRLDSDDPSDEGPQTVLVLVRPTDA
jgi:aminoglycoside 6'-N-acetyltransferase